MPRKLEPGLAATYSRLSDFSTSTMKSPPGRSVVTISASSEGSVSRGAIGAVAGLAGAAAGAGGAVCASAPAALPTRAAPVTAALFRKSRRSTDPFCFIVAVAYNSQRFMAIRHVALFGLLTLAGASSVFAQANRQSPEEFRRMLAMGTKYWTATEFYAALKAAAPGQGRQMPAFNQLPDWSGLWTAGGGGNFFSPGPGGSAPKLTPQAAAALKDGQSNEKNGIEYVENLSQCGPPGYPRWLVIPFLREFIVRPEETWLTSETVNNVRRVYTDGRDHPPVEERYPLYYGDSIGFWDGQKLVIHTNQLMERSMGRNQPTQSEKMETVEIWQNVNPTTVKADVWLFDPELYTEPWYVQRLYTKVPNEDKSLRIRFWSCNENPNNDVVKTPDGSTNYKDFQIERAHL